MLETKFYLKERCQLFKNKKRIFLKYEISIFQKIIKKGI